MLRLSKKADYALMAMKHLAQRDGEALASAASSAREIAAQYDIPHELLAKVLQRLARRGLLDSTQGTHGGYTLGRPARSISVADVIEAIDGPFTVTACSTDDSGGCDQFAKCSIKDPLWQIRERIVETLGTVTMAEMAEDRAAGVPAGVHPAIVRRAEAAGEAGGRGLKPQAEGHER
jgi:Rrf2 family protein